MRYNLEESRGRYNVEERMGDRRGQLLSAAVRVFGRKGFHRAKIEEIAVEAGLGKGTVYEYFSSKQELFTEMLRESGRLYLEKLRGAIGPAGAAGLPIKEALRAIIQAHLEFIEENRELARVIMEAPGGQGGMDRELLGGLVRLRAEVMQLVRGVIAGAVAAGELRAVDPDLAANLFLGMVRSYWGMAFLDGRRLDAPADAELALEIIWDGLRPE